MAYQHDGAGFLVGTVIKTQDQMITAQQDGLRVLTRIRADVAAISRALNLQAKTQARNTRTGAGGQRVQRAPAVTPAGRSGSRTAGGNQTAGAQRAAAQSRSGRASAAVVVVTASRDARGRFVKGAGAGAAGDAAEGKEEKGGTFAAGSMGLLSKVADGVGRMGAMSQSADNIDPTVNAVKEVSDVVTPLGRGLFTMFGRNAERKKERWYQRIWTALKSPVIGPHREAAAGGGVLESLFNGVGKVLTSLPTMMMGLLTRILMPIAAVWGAWELGKWIGGKIYSWLDESGWNTKLFDAVDWIRDTFSNAWTAVGDGITSVVGSIEGAWKTITDGAKSAFDSFMEFPKKIGEFFSGLDESMRGLPIIGKAYAAAADAARSVVADAKKGYGEGKDGRTDAPAASAAQAVARDIGKTVGAVKAVGAQAGAGYDEARGNAVAAPAPTNAVQRAARSVGGAAGTAANWVLGKTSERYESGGKGAGTVSTGAGDFGGASYGTYQLASKTGTLDKFLKSTDYGKQFEGLKAGSAEFNAKWKDVAKNDPKFGDAQHDFIKATHYNPAMSGLKAAGIDLSSRGAAVQDALWSTSVQFGAGSAKKGDGAIGMFSRALAGRDASKMTEAEIVAAVQDYKAKNNAKLFASSSAAVRAGTLNRAASEKAALLKLNAASAGVPAPTHAGLPAPASAGVPAAVPAHLPEQAKDEVPALGASGPGGGAKVQVSLKDKTSQNIGDRGIAHIVTGGLGRA